MKYLLLLDPAHGIDVSGKQSPDGALQEWMWSREMIRRLLILFKDTDKGFDVLCPFLCFDTEPGLSHRVDVYNGIAKDYNEVYMLSIHVDAYGNGKTWESPKGTTIFTSKGETKADYFATVLGETIKENQPNEVYRFDYGLGELEKIRDLDREANFTVIAGNSKIKPTYSGVLIENGFMTNKAEMERMLTDKWKRDRAMGIYLGVMRYFHELDKE